MQHTGTRMKEQHRKLIRSRQLSIRQPSVHSPKSQDRTTSIGLGRSWHIPHVKSSHRASHCQLHPKTQENIPAAPSSLLWTEARKSNINGRSVSTSPSENGSFAHNISIHHYLDNIQDHVNMRKQSVDRYSTVYLLLFYWLPRSLAINMPPIHGLKCRYTRS